MLTEKNTLEEAGSLAVVRNVSTEELVDRVILPDRVDQIPEIIMSIGPCRSGTTVFLRVFAASGIPGSGKPFKVVLRWLQQQEDPGRVRTWTPPEGSRVYLKESIGPYTITESRLDPVKIMFRAFRRMTETDEDARALLRSRIRVIITGRVPEHAWASWLTKYGEVVPRDVLFRHFLTAHHTVHKMRQTALEWGVPVKHYVLEANKHPDTAAKRLFAALNLGIEPVITGWRSLPPFPSAESKIFFDEQPACYERPGKFDKILNSDGLTYFTKSEIELQNILPAEQNVLSSEVSPIYEQWRYSTERDLQIALR